MSQVCMILGLGWEFTRSGCDSDELPRENACDNAFVQFLSLGDEGPVLR
jgi:hypothetical protein